MARRTFLLDNCSVAAWLSPTFNRGEGGGLEGGAAHLEESLTRCYVKMSKRLRPGFFPLFYFYYFFARKLAAHAQSQSPWWKVNLAKSSCSWLFTFVWRQLKCETWQTDAHRPGRNQSSKKFICECEKKSADPQSTIHRGSNELGNPLCHPPPPTSFLPGFSLSEMQCQTHKRINKYRRHGEKHTFAK